MSKMKQEIVSVLVQNRANVLNRVISLYGRRGYNIDSLTVSPTNNPNLSRITIAFTANERSMQQIITQTEKLEVVEKVQFLDRENTLYRELMLLKVKAGPDDRSKIKEIVDICKAEVAVFNKDAMIIQLTDTPVKIDAFIEAMSDFDVIEVCRTGVAGLED